MSKFKKVYFRIYTPSYYRNSYGVGFQPEDRELFYKTVTELFINNGWVIKEKKYGCPTVIKSKQELYLHPQAFSGVVLEENIPEIEHLISNCKLFKFERTDMYEEVFDISDEEYINIFKSKQVEIENDILAIFTTKRSNLYITETWTLLNKVLDKYRMKRLSHYIEVTSSNDVDVQWINEVFENLISEGKIVTAQCKNGTGYRTDKKVLQKISA